MSLKYGQKYLVLVGIPTDSEIGCLEPKLWSLENK